MSTRTRRTLFSSIVAACALVLAAVTSVGLQPAQATTANSSAFRIVSISEDRIRNWDFRSQSAARTNVDWPVVAVFVDDAEVNKVKDIFLEFVGYDQGETCAGEQHAHMSDLSSSPLHWDEDSGKKTTCCPGFPGQPPTADHVRVYSAGGSFGNNDRMYNIVWGYWVLATAHLDHNEPQCGAIGAWYGYSETAEENLYDEWNDRGWPATWSTENFFNIQNDQQGNYHVRSDGHASKLFVE